MENNYRRIKVAAKNVDSREHDIIDSDDYFQYHGGMVATVRALTGDAPKAYVGDTSTRAGVGPGARAVETPRGCGARVVNRWGRGALRPHGCKGAFEMAAGIDYLFGFDATAQVVGDWMHESLANTYLLDEQNQEFLRQTNPWALRSMVERLQESVDRGMWENPDPELINQLHELYLEVDGDLEE